MKLAAAKKPDLATKTEEASSKTGKKKEQYGPFRGETYVADEKTCFSGGS